MPSNNYIFLQEWTDKSTGWEHKLEIIIPSGLTEADDLINPEIVEIPNGCFVVKEQNISYNHYIGMPETPTLAIDFNYSLFKNADIDATAKNNLIYYFFNESPEVLVIPLFQTVKVGIIFALYIKFLGNDSNPDPEYRKIRTYIYTNEGDVKFDFNSVISFEAIDVNYYVLKNLKSSYFKILDLTNYNSDFVTTKVIDFFKDTTNTVVYHEVRNNDVFVMMSMQVFFNYIKNYFNTVRKIVTRNYLSNNILFLLNFPKFYKQLGEDSGARGQELSLWDLCFIGYITDTSKTTKKSGFLYDDVSTNFIKTYENSMYDFFADLSEFTLANFKLDDYFLSTNIVSGVDTINIDISKIEDVKFELNKEKVKSVVASIIESNSTDELKDVDKFEKKIWGTKNEAGFNVPVVFNNMLTLLNVEVRPSSNPLQIRYSKFNPLFRNLYYSDNLYPSVSKFIKVHERPTITFKYFNTVITSDDVVSYYPVNKSAQDFKKYTIDIQLNSIAKYLAEFYLHLMTKGFDTLECKIKINDYVNFEPGGSIGFVWNLSSGNDFLFNFNFSSLDNSFASLDQNWKLISSKINFLENVVECKFLRMKW